MVTLVWRCQWAAVAETDRQQRWRGTKETCKLPDTRGTMGARALGQHIQITPGVAGGKPRIAGHRITVMDIVVWHDRLGRSADEISTEFGLTLADGYAALAYYHDNQAAIDAQMRESEEFVETLRRQIPSRIPGELRG